MHPAVQAGITILVGVFGCIGYFWSANLFLDKVLFPAKGPNAGQNINRANMIRPWLFLLPALLLLALYLAYPVVATLWRSLFNASNTEFVGLGNYTTMFADPKFWESMKNNLLWLVVVPAAATAFGLLAAQLTDRIWWGNIAKSLIFMPMAISSVGAAVIWKLIYDQRDANVAQIGILNAVWMKFQGGFWSLLFLKIVPALMVLGFAAFVAWGAWLFVRPFFRNAGEPMGRGTVPLRLLVGAAGLWLVWLSLSSVLGLVSFQPPYGQPMAWLTLPFWNSFFLMAVLIWIQAGFAMVILSAALRGVPEETIEAAILDGANPFQIFFKIKVPQIMGTIVVVWTTITITVLKVFDIVRAMTNGQWETQVLANYMFDRTFIGRDPGIGGAAAVVIMILVTPILIWNVRNARKELK